MYQEQLSQALSYQTMLPPQSLASATPTPTGSVDMQKFKRALFVLGVGAFGGSATVDMKLQVSPDNSTWTDLASALPATFSGNAITTLLAAGGNNRTASLEIRADQLAGITSPANARYVRAMITVGTAATLVSCMAFGACGEQLPNGQYDVAATAQKSVVAGPT